MRDRRQPRLPYEPFERKLKDPDYTDIQFAESLGVSRDVIRNWKKNGMLFYTADKVAINAGYHPSQIWGDDYWYDSKKNTTMLENA